MAAIRQLQAQFCRDNAATAVGRITGNTDSHGFSIRERPAGDESIADDTDCMNAEPHTTRKTPGEIVVVDRFAPLRANLLTLLTGLGADDWARPTAAPGWSVKDLAAHLLGGDIGILSAKRDGFRPGQEINGYHQLVALVNRQNQEWVLAANRMSPRLLCELLAFCGPEVEACFSALDPMKLVGPVHWAGPAPAPVWFDLAREFTERWHHQQQIRDATGRPPLYDPYFFAPVLDTFVRALPHAFHNAMEPAGTSVRLKILGEAGGVWYLYKTEGAWTLVLDSPAEPATTVVLPQDLAWRLFTKGIDRERARSMAEIEGRIDLVAPLFAATAIIG
jgi:uncharacterized protein (TIGR03083 family)